MKSLSFRGGIHPPYSKEISIREACRTAAIPKTIVIPLSQHIGAPNDAIVKKGDLVEEGQLLGQSSSFVSSPVHSSVSGKVLDVKKAFHPALGPILSVFVETDETKTPMEYSTQNIENLSVKDIIQKVKDAGIVGMGGAAFPTHVKLSVPEGKKIETLIINGAECEPFLTCDHTIMIRKTVEILKGIELLNQVLQPKEIFIAIEDNKKRAIFEFQKEIKKSNSKLIRQIKVVFLEKKYPQGGEKQLIKAISGAEVPPGGLPLDIGYLVQNAGTVYAIYEAVYLDKPLTERIITISGDCVKNPGNFFIKVGTTIEDMIELCGIKFSEEPKKVLSGGPMMGFAQLHMQVPILKSTSGILFFSEKKAVVFEEGQCIKCAKCVDVCPVRLIPTDIMKNVKKENWDRLEELCISDCMECGSCSYACPARIPLVHYIKEGKFVVAGNK